MELLLLHRELSIRMIATVVCGQMRMWHQGWQPVWGRPHLLDRSWEWYLQNLESSQREAQRQVTIA